MHVHTVCTHILCEHAHSRHACMVTHTRTYAHLSSSTSPLLSLGTFLGVELWNWVARAPEGPSDVVWPLSKGAVQSQPAWLRAPEPHSGAPARVDICSPPIQGKQIHQVCLLL